MNQQMKRLKIATLSGCSYCDSYKSLLINAGIEFNEIGCYDSGNEKYCDSLEDASLCEKYPMSVINNTIICLSDDFKKLGKPHINSNYTIIYCHSIDNMLYIVKKILSL